VKDEMTHVGRNLTAIRARIEGAGGDPDAITIVGAKPPSVDACRAAIAAGIVDLGENRAQELLAKVGDVDGARWHFIGRLQTNKVRSLVPHVVLWESVDRLEVVDELALRTHHAADVLVQVNISDEPQKGGCEPGAARGLVRHAQDAGLSVRGLMGIGPAGPPEGARPGFRLLRDLADDLGLPVRSMGMSADLEVAVSEGSTMIRVGTGLFGPRPSADLPPD
jgi:pyridoxal phosphate enzyme (YggS family)